MTSTYRRLIVESARAHEKESKGLSMCIEPEREGEEGLTHCVYLDCTLQPRENMHEAHYDVHACIFASFLARASASSSIVPSGKKNHDTFQISKKYARLSNYDPCFWLLPSRVS